MGRIISLCEPQGSSVARQPHFLSMSMKTKAAEEALKEEKQQDLELKAQVQSTQEFRDLLQIRRGGGEGEIARGAEERDRESGTEE